MSKCCRYAVYRRNFANIILWQHRKIHWSISSLNTLVSGRFWGFEKKTPKRMWLWLGIYLSGQRYRPGKRLKRLGKSSGLYPKKVFAWGVQIFCE